MTLSDFATFCTAISGLAVTASLIYLGLQTYQSTKHTRALLNQGQSNRVVTTLLAMANPNLAETWIAGNGGVPTPETVKGLQFTQLCNAVVYDMMDFHNQHDDGLMSEEMFGTSEVAYSSFLQQPGMRAFWQSWKEPRKRTAPKFIAWVDRLAATSVASSNPNWI